MARCPHTMRVGHRDGRVTCGDCGKILKPPTGQANPIIRAACVTPAPVATPCEPAGT